MKPKFIIFKKDNEILWNSPNDESVDFILDKVVPTGSDYVFMYDDTNIDYSFSSCYDFNFDDENGSTAIPIFNVEKAKQSFLKEIRYRRTKLFPSLDIEYMQALESGNQIKIQEVIAKKEVLRNITEIDFSNGTTPNDLKQKWPNSLLGDSPEYYI
jgi:hypothetical protein